MSNDSSSSSNWVVGEEADKKLWDYDMFHTRATNEHDHSRMANIPRSFRFPDTTFAEMHKFIADPAYPYESVAAFIRDAVMHRIAYLSEKSGNQQFIGANLFQMMLQEVAHEEAFTEDFKSAQEFVETKVRKLELERDVKGLEDFELKAKHLPIMEERYRGKWEAALDEIFARAYKALGVDRDAKWNMRDLEGEG